MTKVKVITAVVLAAILTLLCSCEPSIFHHSLCCSLSEYEAIKVGIDSHAIGHVTVEEYPTHVVVHHQCKDSNCRYSDYYDLPVEMQPLDDIPASSLPPCFDYCVK